MENSEKPSSAKCFSGILRRVFCSGSIPTHPSDDFSTECETKKLNHSEEKEEASWKPSGLQSGSAPGIVARLMGLESLPDVHLSTNTRPFGSFLRSRSVNSIDNLPPIDFTHKLHHRRVKTLTSFCEAPDDHFLSVRFEETTEEKRKASQFRQPAEMSNRQSQVHKNNGEKFTSKKAKDSKRVNTQSSIKVEKVRAVRTRTKQARSEPVHSREASVGSGFKKLRNNGYVAKKLQPQLHTDITKHRQVTKPGNSKPTCSKKSQKKFTDYKEAVLSNAEEPMVMTRNFEKPVVMKSLESEYFVKMLTDIYRLSEDDIKGTPWVASEDHQLSVEALEEMCLRFGQHIFELLLDQVIDELLVIHMMK